VAEKSASTEINRIWLELIRRYLGYGSRYLRYLNVEKEASPQKNAQKNAQAAKSSFKGVLKKPSVSNSVTDELLRDRRKEVKLEQGRS
jgi:hypothetical protein